MAASTTPSTSSPATSGGAVRASLWQRLTEPHPSIEEVGARHLARLLSSILVASIGVTLGGVFVILYTVPAGLPVMLGCVLLTAVAYVISRTRRYLLAATVVVVAFTFTPVGIMGLAFTDGAGDRFGEMCWILLATIIGSLYLPTRRMLVCAAIGPVAAVTMYFALPLVAEAALVSVSWFLLACSLLLVLVSHHRNAVERQRLAVIEQRRVELIELNRGMETMLYVISHDLKEPLRAIQNFSLIVERRYAERLDDKGRDYLRRVARGADRMRGLLDDLLRLSRAQRIEQPNTPVPGAEIVADALGRLDAVVTASGATIEVASDLPSFRVDKAWASGAVYNLVDNALKHAAGDTAPEVEIAGYRGPRGVGLVVNDRGPGVEPEHQEKIFELFQRAVGRDVPGTGAGLAIVRQIAQRHGGSAWVESRSGGGAAFYITFEGSAPAAQTERSARLRRTERQRRAALRTPTQPDGND